MLDRVHHLDKSTVTASDGAIGHVKDVFFDDVRWTIRYLVIDTGHWLSGREVLVLPYAVKPMVAAAKNVDVRLTRQQVTDSPDVDTHIWWPGGKSVLIGTHWIDAISWAEHCVRVKITRAQVRSRPVYDENSPVHRDDEVRLNSAYDRTGYWD